MDLSSWLVKDGVEFLKDVGVGRGCAVLDFGCGSGNYTIPAAKLVGEEGRVYALDTSEWVLDELMRRADAAGLRNIERIDSGGEAIVPLDDESVDVVLLFDIFWYFPLTDPKLGRLLVEVHRVLRPDALLSVYPEHIDVERLVDRIKVSGFRLEKERSGMLLHHDNFERGTVFVFRKSPLTQ